MSFNIATILRESAKTFPDRAALPFEGDQPTYREVDALSDAMAEGLRKRGIRAGDRIGLQLPNIPQFVITRRFYGFACRATSVFIADEGAHPCCEHVGHLNRAVLGQEVPGRSADVREGQGR